ncbi:hypothetical protein D1872_237990 [compost metagenome]
MLPDVHPHRPQFPEAPAPLKQLIFQFKKSSPESDLSSPGHISFLPSYGLVEPAVPHRSARPRQQGEEWNPGRFP